MDVVTACNFLRPQKISRSPVLKNLSCAICATVFMLGLGQSGAQQRPSYGQAVSLETGKKIAAASIAAARRNNWNVAVAPENLSTGSALLNSSFLQALLTLIPTGPINLTLLHLDIETAVG